MDRAGFVEWAFGLALDLQLVGMSNQSNPIMASQMRSTVSFARWSPIACRSLPNNNRFMRRHRSKSAGLRRARKASPFLKVRIPVLERSRLGWSLALPKDGVGRGSSQAASVVPPGKQDVHLLQAIRHPGWRRWVCMWAESAGIEISAFGLGKGIGQAAESLGGIQALQ